jgi:hypothetical protein
MNIFCVCSNSSKGKVTNRSFLRQLPTKDQGHQSLFPLTIAYKGSNNMEIAGYIYPL